MTAAAPAAVLGAWLLLLCAAPSVQAAESSALVRFSHKNWELRCDNTRTCRAAGYQAESGESEPVSLLVTRAAGPNVAPKLSLQLGGEEPVQGAFSFAVGKALLQGLEGDMVEFTPAQVKAVLPELLRNDEAVARAGGRTWTLSLAGASAALLKMDEAQGRLDTPGALVRRGNKPEAAALAPLPMPVVRNVLPVAQRKGDKASTAAFATSIFATLDLAQAREQCNSGAEISAKSLEISRLTDSRLLVALPCGMGAYNFSALLWIASDTPPYRPQAIEANGQFDAAEGSVTSSMKGRGIGDCWWSETWHFDGQCFTKTEEAGDAMCRGFAGGAWSLTSFIARTTTQASPKKN